MSTIPDLVSAPPPPAATPAPAAPAAAYQTALPRAPAQRLAALDVFRGLTIAGMILVTNPGNWGHIFSPLRHADWHGLTPTDLVFPFFLFIVGVALPFSFDKRLGQGASRLRLFEHVVRRSVILFLLGLIMAAFPRWNDIVQPALRPGASAPPLARLLLPVWPGFAGALGWLQPWRGVVPYVLVIVGLTLLFVDEPPLGWPRGAGRRTKKVLALLLLAAGIAYFAADFAYFEQSKVRVPGVLQRIAICYLLAASIVLLTSFRRVRLAVFARAGCVVLLLLAYWAIVRPSSFGLRPLIAAPDGYQMPRMETRPDGLLHDWIDVSVLGTHLYSERPDPEGILSTLPSIATVLLGVLAGGFLRRRQSAAGQQGSAVAWLFLAANVLLVLGLWMALDFPLNKKIWSSSYVVVTAGLALHFLAACYWLVDVQGYRRWAQPFLVLGTNAIAVYFLSSVGARIITSYPILSDGVSVDLKTWLYLALLTWHWPTGADITAFANGSLAFGETVARLASLALAIAYVTVWCVLFIPLYRLRWFIRI